MRKKNFYYDQNKNKRENVPSCKNKRPNNFDPRKKHNNFHKNTGKLLYGVSGKTTKDLNRIIL